MSKYRILSVDDEEDVRELVSAALCSDDEYWVQTAGSGAEALAILKSGIKPDLIICDMMMPRMTGLEVVSALRENPETQKIPVIMLTAIDDRAKIREAIDCGIDYYVLKPFEIADLLEKVRTVLASPTPPVADDWSTLL